MRLVLGENGYTGWPNLPSIILSPPPWKERIERFFYCFFSLTLYCINFLNQSIKSIKIGHSTKFKTHLSQSTDIQQIHTEKTRVTYESIISSFCWHPEKTECKVTWGPVPDWSRSIECSSYQRAKYWWKKRQSSQKPIKLKLIESQDMERGTKKSAASKREAELEMQSINDFFHHGQSFIQSHLWLLMNLFWQHMKRCPSIFLLCMHAVHWVTIK